MIREIHLTDYRGIHDYTFECRPLTIFTGLNSTGKSTCFNALLNAIYHSGAKNAQVLLLGRDFSFAANRNVSTNASAYRIHVVADEGDFTTEERRDGATRSGRLELDLERDVYYLSANRLGYSAETESVSPVFSIGLQGEYVYGAFEREKTRSVAKGLIRDDSSYTLSYQTAYWLSRILQLPLELKTEPISPTAVKINYDVNGLKDFSPYQLGVGVSYLAKVLIMCLRAQKGDVLMIENPEIHLHPAAQSRLGEFLANVVRAGIQVMIETHCEHLLNRIQYEIYKGRLAADDAVLYYKENVNRDFIHIDYQLDGKYSEEFPEGYFDATLSELMEME